MAAFSQTGPGPAPGSPPCGAGPASACWGGAGPIPQGGTGETNRSRPHPKSGERRRARQPLCLDHLPLALKPQSQATTRDLPRTPAPKPARRFAALRAAGYAAARSLGAPVPTAIRTQSRQPAISRDLPPKPERRFALLRATGHAARPPLERQCPCNRSGSAPAPASARDLPRMPARTDEARSCAPRGRVCRCALPGTSAPMAVGRGIAPQPTVSHPAISRDLPRSPASACERLPPSDACGGAGGRDRQPRAEAPRGSVPRKWSVDAVSSITQLPDHAITQLWISRVLPPPR